jgi:TetR/AcrR family transcriptional repressor of lmrAB and yxaGH operons
MLEAAARLFQERGYSGTGLNDVLATSGAPRGSLYFHFPGGKAQLAAEAAARSGKDLCEVMRAATTQEATTAGEAVVAIAALLGGQLRASGFRHGCPVAPFVLEDVDPSVRDAARDAFGAWHDVIQERLERAGHDAKRATELATFALSAIEGALLLCKARQSTEPLEQAASEISRIVMEVKR